MNAHALLCALKERLQDLAAAALQSVEVAVLDSGLDASHPDLAGRVVSAHRVDTVDGRPTVVDVPLGTNNDAYGHGTGVGSIIARIAPNARLVDIRVLGQDNRGSGVALVEGLRFAVGRGSRLVNMSLAASASFAQSIFSLCERAYYRNQILVASKRNMPLTDLGFPAEFSSCISVDNEPLPSPLALLYRPDTQIEYAADGEGVVVAAPGGQYTTVTGTSFATPAVTGLCALIVGAHPDLRPFEVKALLKAFALDQSQLGPTAP